MKNAYARAGKCLRESGGRLLLIEALLLLLLLLPVYFAVSGVALIFLELVGAGMLGVALISGAAAIVLLAYSFFVGVPMVLGLLFIAHSLSLGREASLSELFLAFSSRARYKAALLEGRALFAGCALIYFLVSLLYLVLYPFLMSADVYRYLFAALVLAVLLLGYLFLPMTFHGIRRTTGRRGGAIRGLILRLRFLPMILLGVATLGILLLCDVLPRLLVASAAPLDAIKADGTLPPPSDK